MNDSVWATVLSIAKTFNVTPQFALYEISYNNAILYSRCVPTYGDYSSKTDNAPIYDESKNANNDIDLDDDSEEIIKAQR